MTTKISRLMNQFLYLDLGSCMFGTACLVLLDHRRVDGGSINESSFIFYHTYSFTDNSPKRMTLIINQRYGPPVAVAVGVGVGGGRLGAPGLGGQSGCQEPDSSRL